MVLCCRRSDGRNGINPLELFLIGHSTGRVWDLCSGQNFSWSEPPHQALLPKLWEKLSWLEMHPHLCTRSREWDFPAQNMPKKGITQQRARNSCVRINPPPWILPPPQPCLLLDLEACLHIYSFSLLLTHPISCFNSSAKPPGPVVINRRDMSFPGFVILLYAPGLNTEFKVLFNQKCSISWVNDFFSPQRIINQAHHPTSLSFCQSLLVNSSNKGVLVGGGKD